MGMIFSTPPHTPPPREIIDIREPEMGSSLRDAIVTMFLDADIAAGEERALPTLLLYDAEGLKLFERITYLDEYYLTGAEIAVLTRWAENIPQRIDDGTVVIELGSGNLRKVSILLHALSKSGKKITYYALDVSLPELERTLSQIPDTVGSNITCLGLHGTYDDGLKWLSTNPLVKNKKKCILWLGSSIGNFDRADATAFLKNITETTMEAGDMMLVGIDGCMAPEKVYRAYNDSFGVTREFELNALKHANELLGHEVFSDADWDYLGVWNAQEGRHEAYFVALSDLILDKSKFGRPGQGQVEIKKGERVKIERSYKFDSHQVRQVWEGAGLVEGAKWGGDLHLVYKPPFSFPLSPEKYAKTTFPSVVEWRELWKAWDTITLTMVPKSELLNKPIDLRNPCIFYLGHIPTFLDIHVARATGEAGVAPEHYPRIFERGIDPDVEDPNHCHPHSEAPEDWPTLEEIRDFVSSLRNRVEGLYEDDGEKLKPRNGVSQTKRLKRALWMAFEHEAMHIETFLYMLLQSPSTLPPSGVPAPDWEAEAARLDGVDLKYNPWIEIPAQEISIGMDDPEEDDLDELDRGERHFGWDNEKPLRRGIKVGKFLSKAAPISVDEYIDFLAATNPTPTEGQVPASWIHTPVTKDPKSNRDPPPSISTPGREYILNNFSLRTFFSASVPLKNKYVQSLPLVASYDELSSCAKWLGGRIPTREELQSIYKHSDDIFKEAEKDARRISAVNGEMNARGVTETPPCDSLFAAFEAGWGAVVQARVGFTGWGWGSVRGLPVSAVNTQISDFHLLQGRGETGGAWEWTSSVMSRHEGFKQQREYPEYTADFFDTKHNIVLGGSWATHPKLAGRKTFVNWYQRSYRFTWCTARVVRDI